MTFIPRFSDAGFCVVGDIGKVQWPAGLQMLNLYGCGGITGKF